MARLAWNIAPTFQAGVDRAVFYPPSGVGEVWNGFMSLTENSPSELKKRYLDGRKIGNRQTRDEFSGAIQAFTYPDSFYDDILIQRVQPSFGLSYRTLAGDNYRIHLVYNVVVTFSDKTYRQQNPELLSWNFTTTPVTIPGAKPSAHLILDGNAAYSSAIADLEDILYGTELTNPRLPTPQEVWDLVEGNSLLLVVDHGDGTFSVIGPDEAITMLSATTFEIDWPSVVNIDADTYQISSL